MNDILIYGATGYTGQLAAARACAEGLRPILAGRDAARLAPLAERLGVPWRAFALDRAAAVRAGLADVAVVLHAAGPFSATSRPMADACLAGGTHYVDITGEIDVFEALAARHGEAERARITLLPGAGFDVVPSDCLAAHVAARLPGATRLRLTIGGFGAVSRGTAKTMLEAVADGTRVRRGGRLAALRGTPRALVDLGDGPQPAVGVGWGDVSTAWRSTGIGDIDVFFAGAPALAAAARTPQPVKRLLASPIAQRLLKRAIDRRLPPGPTEAQSASGRHVMVAEAWDGAGRCARSRLDLPEAYALTARTAVAVARRLAAGGVPTGTQTPATAFGPDFILGFPGVTRADLPG